MLLTIAIILLILWALGFFAFQVAGGLIHLPQRFACSRKVKRFGGRRRSSRRAR
jgi:hypothetical protein